MVAQTIPPIDTLPIDQVIHGDCRDVLKTLPSNSIDAIISDPPCNLSFMGKSWDTFGHRDNFIAFMTGIFEECLRIAKPGSHALIWSLPRTSGWTQRALEDAGWECRDILHHVYSADTELHNFLASLSDEQRDAFERLIDSQASSTLMSIFGSGFPKALNVSKAIDALLGNEREVIGTNPHRKGRKPEGYHDGWSRPWQSDSESLAHKITAPASPESAKWNGWHSNLKPAVEHWLLVRKPLSEGNIAANVLKHGTGAINIDACRISYANEKDAEPKDYSTSKGIGTLQEEYKAQGGRPYKDGFSYLKNDFVAQTHPAGRWPANLLLSHTLFCEQRGTKRVQANGPACTTGSESTKNAYGEYQQRSQIVHRDPDGYEEVTDWLCHDSCPVAALDVQSGVRKSGGGNKHPNVVSMFNASPAHGRFQGPSAGGDTGGASRYFQQFSPDVPFIYSSKASKRDRSSNGAVDNTHPTAKSTALMQYLCRLVGVPGGIVLDPFCGSGGTLVACIREGMRFIGIDQSEEYCEIARKRIAQVWKEEQ